MISIDSQARTELDFDWDDLMTEAGLDCHDADGVDSGFDPCTAD